MELGDAAAGDVFRGLGGRRRRRRIGGRRGEAKTRFPFLSPRVVQPYMSRARSSGQHAVERVYRAGREREARDDAFESDAVALALRPRRWDRRDAGCGFVGVGCVEDSDLVCVAGEEEGAGMRVDEREGRGDDFGLLVDEFVGGEFGGDVDWFGGSVFDG